MTGPLDLADVLAHTGWTCPAPRGGDTQPVPEQPKPTADDPLPGSKGPTVWPASADTPPADLDHWWPTRADDFPVRTDPALDGHDPLPVTAADCGLADDPIAVVLELRARLEDAVDQLTPQQRAELAQYRLPEVA